MLSILTPMSLSRHVVNAIVASLILCSAVSAQAVISSLQPPSIVAGTPGSELYITGTSLSSTPIVTVNNVQYSGLYYGVDQTIGIYLPASVLTTPGQLPVVVDNGTTGGGKSAPFNLVVSPPIQPVITSVSPTSVTAGSPLSLTVTGSNMNATTEVRIQNSNGVTEYSAQAQVGSTQLEVEVPASLISSASYGPLLVSLDNVGTGGVSASTETVTIYPVPVPVLTSVTPNVLAPGYNSTTIKFLGSGFFPRSEVTFDGYPSLTALQVTYISPDEVDITDPFAYILVPAVVQAHVVNPTSDGKDGGTSAPQAITIVYNQPEIDSLVPSSLIVNAPATLITVNGTTFNAQSQVAFNGQNAPTTLISATQLSATIPDTLTNAVSEVSVTVTNSGFAGGISNSFSLPIGPIQSFDGVVDFFSSPYAYDDLLSNIFYIEPTNHQIAEWQPQSFSYTYQGDPNDVAITPGHAYWASVSSGYTYLTYAGTPASATAPTTISLYAGWNGIGDPFTAPFDITSMTFGANGITFAAATSGRNALISPTLYEFPQDFGGTPEPYDPVTSSESLQPGAGYWIYAYANTTINFNPPAISVTTTTVTTANPVTTPTTFKRLHRN